MTIGSSPGDGDRVLIVVTSTARRGAEVEGMALAAEMRGRGLAATAVALAPSGSPSPLELEALGPAPLAHQTLRALRRRAKRVSVVVAYGSKSLPACALAFAGCRTPFVYRSIGDPSAWAGSRLRRLRTTTVLRRAGHVVALSSRAASQIQRLYGVLPAAISVAPNARDDAVYVPPTAAERTVARATLGVEPHQPVLSLIGALTAEKRPVLAVETAAQLSDVVLVVAGDGPCRDEVEREARRLGVICHFLGVVPDVRSVLHASDVVVSTSATEGMPGSLIEAALCGVPIVATDVGFVAETVGSGGVIVHPDGDPGELAAAVRTALGSATRFGQLGRRDAVAHLSWNAVAPIWMDVVAAVSPGSSGESSLRLSR